jgi:hypothetical protein
VTENPFETSAKNEKVKGTMLLSESCTEIAINNVLEMEMNGTQLNMDY